MKGRCLSPHTAPAMCDNDVLPVRELSHSGSHNSGGETPVSVPLVMEHFSRAMVIRMYYQLNIL